MEATVMKRKFVKVQQTRERKKLTKISSALLAKDIAAQPRSKKLDRAIFCLLII
jgi:hypothetical protein